MKDSDLPAGVPPSNEIKTDFSGDSRNQDRAPREPYAAPDMATPQYSKTKAADGEPGYLARTAMGADDSDFLDEDENGDVSLMPNNMTPILLILVIGGLLAALGAIVLANNQQELPDCSTQPEWNQYNCRVR